MMAAGLRREERAAMLLLDTVDYPQLFWGALKAGVVAVPLNTLLSTSIGTSMQLLCMSFIAIGERGTAQRRLSDDSNPMPPATATSRRHCAAATTAPNARRHRHRRA